MSVLFALSSFLAAERARVDAEKALVAKTAHEATAALEQFNKLSDDYAVAHSTERTVKLARTAMRAFAARTLKEQGGVCPLCKQPIDLTKKGEGVIDHCHDTGRIRGVLHRSCNAAEGKISNAAARWGCKSGAYPAIIAYLEATAEYLKREPSKFIYPMHKTKEELKDDRNRAAREKRAAAKAAVAVRSRRGK